MRVRALRHAGATVAVASLALALTACGGAEDKKTDDSGKADASASAAAKPDVKALSAAELDKLVVGPADLKGHRVEKAKPADILNPGDVSADKPVCQPLAQAMSWVAPGTPGASVVRKVIEIPTKTGSAADAMGALGAPITSVTLGSYAGEGAQQAFASLKTAGTDCAGGFTLNSSGSKTKVSKVAPATLTAGDEALAWTVTSDMEGEPFVTNLVVVRKGNNLAGFATMSLAGEVKELPKAVVDAQSAKLR
ncbi:hypothetical protein [Streptomyces sp. NPDC090025]|uniref:hypothetical protein n=1 Tax=Streptomyces sp. NPDC090025 TaxID=3365922 RepID=UPI003833D1E2